MFWDNFYKLRNEVNNKDSKQNTIRPISFGILHRKLANANVASNIA